MGLTFIGSHIEYDAYERETDTDELREIIAQLEAYMDEHPRPQEDWGRQNDEDIVRAARQALAALERGEIVLMARDDDGPWFAVAAPDTFRDLPVLVPCDADCPRSEDGDRRRMGDGHRYTLDNRTTPVTTYHLRDEDIQCPDDDTWLWMDSDGDIAPHESGDYRLRCPWCGVVYVLVPAPVSIEQEEKM